MDDMIIEATPEKVKGKPGRKPKAEVPAGVDLDLVKELIAQMQAGNTETLRSLASELRKPTELEQKKLDDDKASQLRRAQMAISAAKMKERQDNALIAQCRSENGGHANDNGGTRFRAQVNSNGYYVPLCMKCHLQLPPIKATAEEIQNGVMLGQYKTLTEDQLIQLAKFREQKAS